MRVLKNSTLGPAVSTAFRIWASTFKIMQRSNMADFLRLCIVLCVSKVYCTVIEFNVWLWDRMRIADYFPALLLPEAYPANSNKIEVNKRWSWLQWSGVGFKNF